MTSKQSFHVTTSPEVPKSSDGVYRGLVLLARV